MKLKKVLAVALAVTMLGSLTACGGNGGSGETAVKTPVGKEASAEGEKIVNIAMTTTMGDLDPFAPPRRGVIFCGTLSMTILPFSRISEPAGIRCSGLWQRISSRRTT